MADNLETWHEYSSPLEGRVNGLYTDIRELITCAVGNLVDPVSLALKVPFRVNHGKGPLATSEQVRAAWQDIKDNAHWLKDRHWKLALARNDLRITEADIDDLVQRKLFEFELHLRRYFPNFVNFPADAQLAICSIAWACGPAFPLGFPLFTAAANRQDWAAAKIHGKISEKNNAGVIPRNANNRLCFDNAAIVQRYSMDLEELHWPKALEALSSEPEPVIIEPVVELVPLELPTNWHKDLEGIKRQDYLELNERWD